MIYVINSIEVASIYVDIGELEIRTRGVLLDEVTFFLNRKLKKKCIFKQIAHLKKIVILKNRI